MDQKEMLDMILSSLETKNFQTSSYLALFGWLMENLDTKSIVPDNIRFFRSFVGLYCPVLPLNGVEYETLQGLIVKLSEEHGIKGELDFSAIQAYLSEKYE